MELSQDLEKEWSLLLDKLEINIGKRPADLNAVLFLIGIQELGKGPLDFNKEQKQDLMHIAVCKVLSLSNFYELEGLDEEGWPHWKSTQKLPYINLKHQETVLKEHVVKYFQEELIFF